MAIGNLTMQIMYERRPCTYTSQFDRKQYGVQAHVPVKCHSLGIFPYNDPEEPGAVMYLELDNGQIMPVEPEAVRFLDTELKNKEGD